MAYSERFGSRLNKTGGQGSKRAALDEIGRAYGAGHIDFVQASMLKSLVDMQMISLALHSLRMGTLQKDA